MASVFISYSHLDKPWFEELQKFLRPLERDFPMIAWTDQRIRHGDDWKDKIDLALAQADIALLLITQAFLASDFIAKEELPYLLDKHEKGFLTLIPLFCETSAVMTVAPALAKLQGCGSPDQPLAELGKPKRLKHYVSISNRLVELAKKAESEKTPQNPPQPGTSPAKKPFTDPGKQPRLEPREYALIIHLDRQAGQWLTHYQIPGHEPFLSTQRPVAAIWQPLQALLDIWATGKQDEIQSVINTASRYWGQVLFDSLFGTDKLQHESIFRNAFQQGQDRSPTPVWGGLRLRIASPLPEIARLPWRLTAWEGRSLCQEGWVFVSGKTTDPLNDIHTTVPNNIVLLDGLDDADAHRLRLLQTVQAVWNDQREPLPYVRWPKTLDQLDNALTGLGRVHWVYLRGQIEGGGEPALMLGAERLPLRDLAKRLVQHATAVLFCNTTQDPALDLAGFFPQVPLVLSRLGRQGPQEPLDLPVAWLQGWLGQGLDPVTALHQLQTDPVELHRLAIRADYRHWQTPIPCENLRASVAHLLLDRIKQKGETNEYISKLIGSHAARAMALVPYGGAGNHMALAHEQLLEAAQVALQGRAAIKSICLQFPPSRVNLRFDLEQELAGQLKIDHASGETVEQLLKRHAPRPVEPGRCPVLWLHWGLFVYQPPNPNQASKPTDANSPSPLTDKQLSEWLGFVSGYLATRCPNNIRLVCSLSIEACGDDHSAIEELLDEKNALWTDEKCRLRILPPLDIVPRRELLDFLTDYAQGCPQSLRTNLAKHLIRVTGGEFERLAVLLQEAETSRDWYGLLERLEGM